MRNTFFIRSLFFAASGLFILSPAIAQSISQEYQKRAEASFANIWKRYRVAKYPGLFLENYPATKTDTLTYMEGGAVTEKEVSFLWPFSAVFSAANELAKLPASSSKYRPYIDTCVSGIEYYRDTTRKPTGYQAYPVQFEKSDRYYDDNGLVGIDYMEAYYNTKNPVYLKRAETVFAFIISGWNEDLGGGVTWLEGHKDQKPACSNGTATLTALKIYAGNKNKYYLDWGVKFYDWMYQNLLTEAGVYANDKKMDSSVNKTYYTYNSGFMLEAAVLLYEFTGQSKYLAQAERLANDSYKHFTAASANDSLNFKIDLPWFVTVLFRGYEALYKVNGNDKYIKAVEHDLNYAWQNTRDRYGLTTHSWTANPDEMKKYKWLLDEGCIAELYGRLSLLAKARQ